MSSAAINSLEKNSLPILFAYIGWACRYDGTEPIEGNFSYVKQHPKETSEAYAFYRDGQGLYRCGVGRGQLGRLRLNVVLVARDPKDGQMKIVGLYPKAEIEMDGYWAVALCSRPILLPCGRRPMLGFWPPGQGLRRWARRLNTNSTTHLKLRTAYNNLVRRLPSLLRGAANATEDTSQAEFEGFEGKLKRRYVAYRSREYRFRLAKIREALRKNNGRLICEVPNCGFDFAKRYGQIGAGYAQVHHLRPLSLAPRTGSRKRLDDLAIVCANCHAMIHHDGQCRPLKDLITR